MNRIIHTHIEKKLHRQIHVLDENLYERLSHIINTDNIEVNVSHKLRTIRDNRVLNIFLLTQDFFENNRLSLLTLKKNISHQAALFFYVGNSASSGEFSELIDFSIPEPVNETFLNHAIDNGFELLKQRYEIRHLRDELSSRNAQIQELAHIGQRLMMVKDLSTLLNLILRKSREVTLADAGSLYFVEEQ